MVFQGVRPAAFQGGGLGPFPQVDLQTPPVGSSGAVDLGAVGPVGVGHGEEGHQEPKAENLEDIGGRGRNKVSYVHVVLKYLLFWFASKFSVDDGCIPSFSKRAA